jgi:REP element-mobilizing transposase RayT
MSSPQQYLPGTFYEVTRRCVERAHKLTPNYASAGKQTRAAASGPGEPRPSSVEQLYQYATARYAEAYGVAVIAVCVMSNHIHEILLDRRGEISKFLQKRNAMFANMVKVRYGLAEGIFSRRSEKYNRLEGAEAIAQKIAYVIANPVAAGLVASPEEWPGMVSSVEDLLGKSVVVRRPLEYLAQDDATNPPEVTFRLAAPAEAIALFGDLSEMTKRTAAHLERNVKQGRRRHSGRFVGPLRVLATSPRTRATTFEPFGERTPRHTTAGDLAVAKRLIAEMRAFRRAHRIALEAVKAGKRRVTFPAGTGKMHFTYGYPREVHALSPAA